jgi:hypothetical protein
MPPQLKTFLLLAFVLILIQWANRAAAASDKTPTKNDNSSRTFYVAPQKAGDSKGTSKAGPADFRDTQFWSVVRQAVQNSPTIVFFLDGTYAVSSDARRLMPTLLLADLGSEKHTLTLQGISDRGAVFTRLATDTLDDEKGPGLFYVTRSQNLVIRNLHFTAIQPMGYATRFGGNRNIRVEHCSWIDLPRIYYGATGTSENTDHVTFRDCVFKRIGTHTTSHMAYNAYGPQHIAFINCRFEDGAGDYVRFRDRADYGVVVGCTFESTRPAADKNVSFISVPLFNDDDPQNPGPSPNYEYFGTHFLIVNNNFIYSNDKHDENRVALLFHHSGFDPPGRNHLLTLQQGQLLKTGDTSAKKRFIWNSFHLDADSIHFFNNRFTNVGTEVAYRSRAAFGARSKGGDGTYNIADVVNRQKVIDTEAQALTFFN